MDAGSTPSSDYTKDYQSGALSFEILSNGKKLISNCGYYKNKNIQIKSIIKIICCTKYFIIDDNSSCKFKKINNSWVIKKGLK
jgi:uncharacterized heparinase superfamily protein